MQDPQNEQRNEQLDGQLQAWFSEQRCSDGQIAPAFEKSWSAAQRRRDAIGQASGGRPRLALAAVLLIATGAMILIVHNIYSPKQPTTLGVNSPPAQQAAPAKTQPPSIDDGSISSWQSPTAFILEQAAEEASPGAGPPMRRDDIHFDF